MIRDVRPFEPISEEERQLKVIVRTIKGADNSGFEVPLLKWIKAYKKAIADGDFAMAFRAKQILFREFKTHVSAQHSNGKPVSVTV